MRVSIITPLFNRLELTRACMESLRRTVRGVAYEWIFIDDGSTDGTREFLRTLPDDGRFCVVLNETPRGFAANNNLGAKLARAPLLCLLNNDTVLLPGWLEPMARLARLLPDVACVGNVQREPFSGLIDHAGIYFHDDGYPRHVAKDDPAPPREDYLQWPAVTAACCVIRRRVFLGLGGFDESFRNGSEDVDFCLRAGSRGYRHFVANRSVIYHHISSSPGRMQHEASNQRVFRDRWSEKLRTDLRGRRTLRENQQEGWRYLRKHAWQPWRYNLWRVGSALERVFSPHPPSRRLDLAPRLLFAAQEFLGRRGVRHPGAKPAAAARSEPSVFLVVGDTAQTADRSGVPTTVRRLAAAFGRMGAPVRPVMWKPATRSLCLLPPELSIGLDAEALRPPPAAIWTEPSAAAPCDPSVGTLRGVYTDTPSLHELLPAGSVPRGTWIVLPEVFYQGRAAQLLEYVRRHGWRLAVILYDRMATNEPRLFPRGLAHEHELYLRAISGADLLLPISGFVTEDWHRFVHAKDLPRAEVRTCPPGVDLGPGSPAGPSDRDPSVPVRVLCVSAVVPRKNHRTLMAAYDLVRASRPDLDIELWLVGMPGVFNDDNVPEAVEEFIARHPEKVRWMERVEYNTLCRLYEECDFTVYPSVLEGRGYPIVESLWFGRPCICANSGAMRETAEGGGCVTVDITDPQALADAIITLADGPERLAALGAEIARRWPRKWEEYARELLAGLREPPPVET